MNWFHRPPLSPRWLAIPFALYLAASHWGWL